MESQPPLKGIKAPKMAKQNLNLSAVATLQKASGHTLFHLYKLLKAA
jgi:hypothetical protein